MKMTTYMKLASCKKLRNIALFLGDNSSFSIEVPTYPLDANRTAYTSQMMFPIV